MNYGDNVTFIDGNKKQGSGIVIFVIPDSPYVLIAVNPISSSGSGLTCFNSSDLTLAE